eukprot:Nk52_evm1s80 gene=Nk52_evmTU1s80
MDDDTRVQVDLSCYCNHGLPKGETLQHFVKWWLSTYLSPRLKQQSLQLLQRYNPVGKRVAKVISDIQQLVTRCGDLLKETEACTYLRQKIPRDALCCVTSLQGKKFKTLAAAILEAEKFLYPKTPRYVAADTIDPADIVGLDPLLIKPQTGKGKTGEQSPSGTKPPKGNADKWCSFHQVSSHSDGECRSQNKDKDKQGQDRKPAYSSKPPTPPSSPATGDKNATKTCHLCKEIGHISPNCPNKAKIEAERKKMFATEMYNVFRSTTGASSAGGASTQTGNANTDASEATIDSMISCMTRLGYSALRQTYSVQNQTIDRRVAEKFVKINKSEVLAGIDSYSSDSFCTHSFVSKNNLNIVACQEKFDTLSSDAIAHYKLADSVQ